MKYAIRLEETLTRTVIVEAEDYLAAEDKVADAYYKGDLQLHADNSSCDLELSNETKTYLDIFGEDEFGEMEVCNEIK